MLCGPAVDEKFCIVYRVGTFLARHAAALVQDSLVLVALPATAV